MIEAINKAKRGKMDSLKITRISVHTGNGPDRVYVELDTDTPFPNMKYTASAKMDAQAGYGIEWVRKVFGREPDEVLNLG